MSKDATNIYSTWLSVSPLGYCDRSFRRDWGAVPARCGADRDECCEDEGSKEVDLLLGSEIRSLSIIGGCGDRGGFDICDADLEEGKDDKEVRRRPVLWLVLLCFRDM